MKKLSIYLGIIVILFAGLYGLNRMSVSAGDSDAQRLYKTKASNLTQATVAQLKDQNYQNIIIQSEMDQKLKNKDSFFAYFFQPTCEHCQKMTPILSPLSKSMGIDMKQFNLTEFKDGWQKYNVEATPTLVYYKDGVEADRLVGENTEQAFKDFFNKHK